MFYLWSYQSYTSATGLVDVDALDPQHRIAQPSPAGSVNPDIKTKINILKQENRGKLLL
jgi:hypothetical protein